MAPELTTEQLVAAYKGAGAKEQKLIRDLARAEKHSEVKILLEILHYFPGSTLLPPAPQEAHG